MKRGDSVNENKLKAKCVERGISIEDCAEKIGINKSTFYRKMKQESFTIKEANGIVEELSLSEDEITAIFFAN